MLLLNTYYFLSIVFFYNDTFYVFLFFNIECMSNSSMFFSQTPILDLHATIDSGLANKSYSPTNQKLRQTKLDRKYFVAKIQVIAQNSS